MITIEKKSNQPSTKEIITATGLFLAKTGSEYKNPKPVEHTCPQRKKLAKKNPSAIVVAANNAGKDIPLNEPAAKGFGNQADLENHPMMTREDLIQHAAEEKRIKRGFQEEANRIVQEINELEELGVLSPEEASKKRELAAYNYSGSLIHSVLFAVKATAVPGGTTRKMYELDKAIEKIDEEEGRITQRVPRNGNGGCSVS